MGDVDEQAARNRRSRTPTNKTARERRGGERQTAADNGESQGEGGHTLKHQRPGIGREEQLRPLPPTDDRS